MLNTQARLFFAILSNTPIKDASAAKISMTLIPFDSFDKKRKDA